MEFLLWVGCMNVSTVDGSFTVENMGDKNIGSVKFYRYQFLKPSVKTNKQPRKVITLGDKECFTFIQPYYGDRQRRYIFGFDQNNIKKKKNPQTKHRHKRERMNIYKYIGGWVALVVNIFRPCAYFILSVKRFVTSVYV